MKYLSLGQQKFLFVLALFILAIIFFRFYYHPIPYPSEKLDREIVVEVLGEVRKPGTYVFKNPPTLTGAIEKSGGLKNPGLIDRMYSSEILETGTQVNVYINSPGETKIKLGRMEANKLLVFSISLDLNRVSVEDLCLIPGVGETLAHDIVDYRERRRGFRSVEELRNVKGIGEKKYESIKNYFALKK